ncbi:dTDP-glucose 4,6-dehydratase [Caenimonas terrae]|uniref:dTDP-glucose 4,6-dehydratase n=1 Tax=Caenimonas terrae TaxID=696074 RepID=A0ABW0NN00_9BURK
MILVTGGCGFIGSAFILQWLQSTDEPVVNLDLLTYAGHPGNLSALDGDARYSFHRGDIGDSALTARLLAQHKPRAVLNFAAETHVDRSISGPLAFAETNVMGTLRLLDAVLAYWKALQPADAAALRFLHVSTDEVYGSLGPDDAGFTEEHRYEPNSPYSASKAASDHFVRAYRHTYGLPTLTTNCSNNYGPRQFPEKLIPLVIHNAVLGKPLPIYGDGLQVRDWLHVEDHCRAIRAVLERGRPGETYNVGGRSERSNLAVVRAICDTLDAVRPMPGGRRHSELVTHVKDRPGHDRRYAIDDSKIAGELGWQPTIGFEQGIRQTVEWYLAHQQWVESVTSGAYRQWVDTHYNAQGGSVARAEA